MSGLMCLEVRKGKRNALVGSDQNWGKACRGRPGVGSVWRSPWVQGGTGRALRGYQRLAPEKWQKGVCPSEQLAVRTQESRTFRRHFRKAKNNLTVRGAPKD